MRLKNRGTNIDIHELWTQTDFISTSSSNLFKIQRSIDCSDESFANVSASVEVVLNALKYFSSNVAIFSKKKGGDKPKFSWDNAPMNTFAEALIQICGQLEKMLCQEPRCLAIESPAYVLGDLHGNFEDLIAFESTLWHLSPVLSPCKILCLGDYVDRGKSSIEIVAYLFAYKCKCYDKIHLLRGNHEIRSIQRMFTFHR